MALNDLREHDSDYLNVKPLRLFLNDGRSMMNRRCAPNVLRRSGAVLDALRMLRCLALIGILGGAGVAQAAIINSIPNGDFETPALAANTWSNAVPNWYESSNAGFGDYTYRHLNQMGDDDPNFMLETPSGYIYQSLGTLDGTEAAITITGTAIKRSNRFFANVTFELFAGAFPAAADGVPLTGLTLLGTSVLTTSDLGFPTAQRSSPHQTTFTTSPFRVTGQPLGMEIWLRITSAQSGNNRAPGLDDLALTVTAIPEPSSLTLIGLAALGLVAIPRLRRFRQASLDSRCGNF